MNIDCSCVYFRKAECTHYKHPEKECWFLVNGKCNPKRKTNADRIRAMNDEELANWLVAKTVYQESAFSHPSYLNFLTGSDDTKERAVEDTIKWLKQTVEVN